MNRFIYPILLSYPLLGMTQDLDIKELLNMSLEELMQVPIKTASKVAEKIAEVPASVVLLTRQDIQRYGYTSITEILQHVSGIYEIESYSPGGPTHGIRGYVSTSTSNRSIIILVNGMSQLSDYDASYYFTAVPVPVEAIDRIEIVRGPLSVVYGSGAFFGAINIITNEIPQKSGFSSRVSVLTGSRESRRLTGRLSYAHSKGRFVLNAFTSQTAGLDIPYSQLESKPLGLEAGMTSSGRLEHQEEHLELSGNYQDFTFDLTHSEYDKEAFVAQPSIHEGTVSNANASHLRLGYQKSVSPQLTLMGKLTYIKIGHDLTYDGAITANGWGIRNTRNTAYEGELNLWWKPQSTFELSSGLYYREVPNMSSYINLPSLPAPSLQKATQRLQPGEDVATWAWFSQLNYSPTSRWKWVAGLRLEQTLGYTAFTELGRNATEYRSFTPHYDDQELAIIPRLAAIYTPNEKHIFKWLYGKAISSPSFSQNTSMRQTNDLPKLEEENIETLEFDYLTYLSPTYLLSVNLFHNRLQNLLSQVMTLTPTGQYVNFLKNSGELRTNGVELSLQAQPTKNLHLELSTTYQQTEDQQNPDREVPFSPHWLGQLKLGYQWTPTMTLGLTGYYVSSMESPFDLSLRNPDGGFGRRLGNTAGEHLVVNANFRYIDWLTRGTFVNLHLYNLFDTEIRYPTTSINSWANKGMLGWERSVMMTVGYEF